MLGWLGLIIHIVLSIIFYLLWLRILCQFFKVPESQPLYRWILHWSEYLVRPLASVTARFESSRIDTTALLTWLILALLQYYVLSWIAYGFSFHFLIVLISVLGDGVCMVLQLLFYAMIIRFAIHYFEALRASVFNEVVMRFTDPLIKLSKPMFPVSDKVDLAPIIWIVVLKIVGYVIYVSMPLHL